MIFFPPQHDLKNRIISGISIVNATPSILFVDKIAGVPVSSTVDNIKENMAYQVELLLPRNSPPLHLASRLDVCTSGMITFDVHKETD